MRDFAALFAEVDVFNGLNVGRGREGSVCFGSPLEGKGPCTRFKDDGGGRRGIYEYQSMVLRVVGDVVSSCGLL